MKILMNLGREQAGRASIDKIADFNALLPFPSRSGRIRGHTADVFEIDLNFFQEAHQGEWGTFPGLCTFDESGSVENFPDRAGGARQAQTAQA